jgi:putative ABC transport system permease protein
MKQLIESIIMALDAVRANKLRSGLTLLSIAIGIFAIIGAGTAVTSLNDTVSGELASLGQNTFQVRRRPAVTIGRNQWLKYQKRKPINYGQAKAFKERMTTHQAISIANDESNFIVKANGLDTDPDVTLYGVDGSYFECTNVEVDEGRQINDEDVNLNRNVILLGRDVASRLFPFSSPLGQEVTVKGHRYTVVGLIKARGSLLGAKLDNLVIVPISLFLKNYQDEFNQTVDLYVKSGSQIELPIVIDEAIGAMRVLRNVKPGEENNFEIETNESMTKTFASFTDYLTYFGFACGSIALVAAGVGIMNIMLVSVKERTKEIGIRKAIGATRSVIMTQFVIEAVTLCQLGGVGGIVLGLLGGAALGSALGFSKVSVPTMWVVGSVGICTLLGIIFGSYPAWQAARLDPIEALRYE